MKRYILFLSFLFPVLLFAQEPDAVAKNWTFKTDLLNPIFNSASLEVERRIAEKVTMGVRVGITGGRPVFEEFKGNLWGFYAKVGPKFYLNSEKAGSLAGFAIQPQLMYSYYHDWDANLYGNKGARWENSIGLLVQGSYVFALGETFRLEPMIGIGYAPTFYDEVWPNDGSGEPSDYEYHWLKEDWEYVEQPSRTHIPLPLDIAVSVGLQIGITF
jgi:hypothetical protein